MLRESPNLVVLGAALNDRLKPRRCFPDGPSKTVAGKEAWRPAIIPSVAAKFSQEGAWGAIRVNQHHLIDTRTSIQYSAAIATIVRFQFSGDIPKLACT